MADNKNNLAGKAIDIAGAAAAVTLAVAFQETLTEGARLSREASTALMKRLSVWRHHQLVVWLRPLLVLGIAINLVVTIGVALYYLFGADESAPWSFTAFMLYCMGVIALMAFRLLRIWDVKSVSKRQALEFARQRQHLTAEELRKEFWAEYGHQGRFGPGTLLLLVGSYTLIGIGIVLFSSVLYDAGATWGTVVMLKVLALALAFLSIVHLAVGFLILGTAAKFVGGSLVGVYKALWDSILTVLPNIQEEEAKELLPDLKLKELWNAFKAIVLSTPGMFLLAYYALHLVWPGLSAQPIIIGALVVLGLGTLVYRKFGNDDRERTKRAGALIATITVVGVLYRIVEYLVFDGRQIYPVLTEGAATHGSEAFGFLAPWWNGLTGMAHTNGDWADRLMMFCSVTTFLLIFGGLFYWLLRLEVKSSVGRAFRWIFIVVLGALVVTVFVGIAAGFAGVDVTTTHAAAPDHGADTHALLERATGREPERVGMSPAQAALHPGFQASAVDDLPDLGVAPLPPVQVTVINACPHASAVCNVQTLGRRDACVPAASRPLCSSLYQEECVDCATVQQAHFRCFCR